MQAGATPGFRVMAASISHLLYWNLVTIKHTSSTRFMHEARHEIARTDASLDLGLKLRTKRSSAQEECFSSN